jgi:hypothetical protein
MEQNPEAGPDTQTKLDALKPQFQAVEAAKTGDFSKLKLSTEVKDLKNLNVEANNFAQNMRASAAAINNLQAQIKAITIGEKDAVLRASFAEPKKKLEAEERSVALTKQGLDIQGKLVTQGNLAFLSAKQTLEVTQLDLQQRIAILANDVEIARQKQIIKDPDASKKIKDAAIDRKAKLEAEGETLKTQQQQQKTNLTNSQIQEKLGALAFNAEEARKREAENAELALAKKSEELKIQESLFAAYSSIGLLSETQKVNQKFLLEQKSAELDYEQKIAKLKSSAGQQMGGLDAREEAIWTQLGAGTGNQAALIAELDKIAEAKALITARTNEEAASVAKVRDNTLSIANAIKTAGLEQERYNQLLNSGTEFADALKAGFEGAAESSQKIADALGTVATTMAQVAVNAEQRAKSEKLAQENVDKAFESENYETIIKAQKEQAELKKKNVKQELADDIKTLNSSKKLFKEKTAAYKILNGMEKIMHVKRIALELKEFAVKMGLITQEQVAKAGAWAKELAMKANNALISIGIDIPAIYAKFMATMGPWGAAAAGAAIAAYVGGAFGGGGSAPFTPTAEQRQETQGTAMGYDSAGNKVQTSRGVFGNTEAKSESIANSLEIIKDNSVKGLDYDDKMLRSLQNLTDALDTTAKGLYGIKGLRAGSLSGVAEGTNSSGGLLGIGGLFSKSVTKSIIDSGLQLKGTFLELVQGLEGTINTFETVSTTVKRSGFLGIGGGTSTSVSTNFKDLGIQDPKAFKSLVAAFGYASDLLYEVADTAGKDAAVVTTAMSQIRIDQMASLRGLTGEQFTSELSAVIGSVLDETSLVLFAEFEKFANFGEGMLETVIRVIDTNKKVDQALENIGVDVNLTKLYGITEALAKAAGGLDKFIDQTNYFSENFLTEAERLAPVQEAVTKEMARLGYSSVDTREEFKLLVQSFDLTNPAVHETYQALMNVQEGFIAVTEAAVKEAEERKSLEQKLFELTATREQLRERELEGLFAGNRALQRQIWLVEEQSEILKTSATSFRDFSKQVKDFRNSLLLGAGSTLTPGQKYAEAKSQFDTIYAQALAGDKVAMGKVTNSAQTFLDASKTYFASSAAYTTDFNTVLTKLDNASISAEASASVAELQLSALGVQTTLLTSINANIATIAGVPQAAGGGRVKGLTLVGELGPELVDFTNPGQVYTAEQTAGMFAPKAGVSNNMNQVVQELRQVRQEIAQLRKDQQQQTGDLIVSNYDANNRAAEVITTEVANTATQKEWQQRNKVAVV